MKRISKKEAKDDGINFEPYGLTVLLTLSKMEKNFIKNNNENTHTVLVPNRS